MKPYFEIDELEKWLNQYIDITKYRIISIETEKNSKLIL